MREVVFVDGARSAFTELGAGLRNLSASEIGAFVINGLYKRSGIAERGGIDGVMAGTALGDLASITPARYAVLAAGLPIETEAHFVEMQCGSAITAINHAAAQIGNGDADVMIVGGFESYSTCPAYFRMDTPPYKLIPPTAVERHFAPLAEDDIDMLRVSDNMAQKWDITRQACDEFALQSQQRMAKAYEKGITGNEIIPYVIQATKKAPEQVVNTDGHPRPGTTMEGLAKLRTALPNGVTTAGNASGRNDGAAFVLMMSGEKAKALGYTPYARWVMGADIGCKPGLMGIGLAYSNLKALKLAGLSLADMHVIECNEAFAAQNLAVIKEMESQTGQSIDREKWNPNGGAIAIGHPNAASGARLCWFTMKQLEQTGGRYGLFGACCGGGHGTTTIIENLRT